MDKKMKDKEKQITEMAQLIADNCSIHKVYVNKHYPDRQKDMYYSLAEELLKHYQPKLPKDSIVLSKEEDEELRQERSDYITELQETHNENCGLRIELEETSKETTEKIILSEIATIKNIRDDCILPEPKYREGYVDCCNTILFYLKNNLARQFGVEIKEN